MYGALLPMMGAGRQSYWVDVTTADLVDAADWNIGTDAEAMNPGTVTDATVGGKPYLQVNFTNPTSTGADRYSTSNAMLGTPTVAATHDVVIYPVRATYDVSYGSQPAYNVLSVGLHHGTTAGSTRGGGIGIGQNLGVSSPTRFALVNSSAADDVAVSTGDPVAIGYMLAVRDSALDTWATGTGEVYGENSSDGQMADDSPPSLGSLSVTGAPTLVLGLTSTNIPAGADRGDPTGIRARFQRPRRPTYIRFADLTYTELAHTDLTKVRDASAIETAAPAAGTGGIRFRATAAAVLDGNVEGITYQFDLASILPAWRNDGTQAVVVRIYAPASLGAAPQVLFRVGTYPAGSPGSALSGAAVGAGFTGPTARMTACASDRTSDNNVVPITGWNAAYRTYGVLFPLGNPAGTRGGAGIACWHNGTSVIALAKTPTVRQTSSTGGMDWAVFVGTNAATTFDSTVNIALALVEVLPAGTFP